jgi:hypothetical protein
LLGRVPSIEKLREQIRQVVGGMSHGVRLPPILLEGETGTGKNLVARVIHRACPQRHGPFVDVNCAGHRPSPRGEPGPRDTNSDDKRDLCREGNYDLLLPPTAAAPGEALTLAGRVEEALPLLEQAVETAAAKG